MSKNGNKKGCPFADEIVSYIYGEISGKAENDFETHLADCMICTDEFAAVSNSRFSVYEWKKEAFDPLPAPKLVVPYSSGSEKALVGFLAAVRAWAAGLSMPVAVAAGLAVCVGLGFIVVSYIGGGEQRFVSNDAVRLVQPDGPHSGDPPFVQPPDSTKLNPIVNAAFKRVPSSAAKRMAKGASPDINKPVNNFAIGPNRTPQVQKAPALSVYDDNDDNSLRLADLFDEVGG